MPAIDLHEPGVLVLRLFIFLIGACVGSFLAASAWRIPRQLSILSPSSCVNCQKPVPWIGLVPVLGYFLVGGKCRSCQARVSFHYAAFEFLIGLLTLVVVEAHVGAPRLLSLLAPAAAHVGGQSPIAAFGELHYGFVAPMMVSLWLLYSGGLLSLIDLEFRILPDVITLPGIIFGLALSALDSERGVVFGILGAVAGGGGLWLVAFLYRVLRKREGMGMGDVKYLALIGAVLGWNGVLWCLMISSLIGSVFGIGASLYSWFVANQIKHRVGQSSVEPSSVAGTQRSVSFDFQQALPFGPFLAGAALLYSLYSPFFHQLFFPAE